MDTLSLIVLLAWTIGAIVIVGGILAFYIAGVTFEVQAHMTFETMDEYKAKHPIKSMIYNSLASLPTLPKAPRVVKHNETTNGYYPSYYPAIKK